MSLFYDPVIFEIKANATQAIASFGRVNAELSRMEKNGLVAGGALGKMERVARLTRVAFFGLAGTVGIVGKRSLDVFGEMQVAQSKLRVAVENTGVAFNDFTPYLDDQRDKFKDLGFTQIQVMGALSRITAATGSPRIAIESLGTAADLARFKNISLAQAGVMVGKAAMGSAKGLDELGVAIGKTVPKGADLQTIMKRINEVAGGAAVAYGDTLPGKMDKFRAEVEDLQLSLGEKLLPKANEFMDWVNTKGVPGFEKFTKTLGDHKDTLKNVGAALAGLWIGGRVAAGISAVASAVSGLGAAIGSMGGAALFLSRFGGPLTMIAGTAAAVGLTTYRYVSSRRKPATSGMPTNVAQHLDELKRGAQMTRAANLAKIQGKGLPKVSAPSGSVNVVQNITVYAKNANAMTVELARAARNGVTLGVSQMKDALTPVMAGSSTRGGRFTERAME